MAFIPPIFRKPQGTPSIGLQFHDWAEPMTCATAVTAGDLLAVSNTPNATTGRLDTIATPATADFSVGSNAFTNKMFCVALESFPAGGSGLCMFSGECLMNCAASQTAGNFLIPANGVRTGAIVATGSVGQGTQVVAQAKFTDVAGAGLKQVYFDGVGGFFRVVTNAGA